MEIRAYYNTFSNIATAYKIETMTYVFKKYSVIVSILYIIVRMKIELKHQHVPPAARNDHCY